MMQTFVRPSRDLRNHYAELSEMLKDHNHVIITNHGRGESVLINIEDYAKYEEFLHQRYVAEALAVRVLVEDDELPVLLLLHDEPVLRREARLSEPDLLLPGWLLAASQRDRLLCVSVRYMVE